MASSSSLALLPPFSSPSNNHSSPLPDPALALAWPPPSSCSAQLPSSQSVTPLHESTRLYIIHHFIAHHYRVRSFRSSEERNTSPILHLKKLHNWLKSVLIQLHTRRGDSVLDLACGKGGDIQKWESAQIGSYVGADIVESSLEQATKRYNEELIASFPARFICADCFGPQLREALQGDALQVDVCSCQFALHYSWSSEERARAALSNAAWLLKPGGYFIGTIPDADRIIDKLRESRGGEFGNKVYKVRFDMYELSKMFGAINKELPEPFGIQYEFHLEDAVDHCPEWLVPFCELRVLAEEYGLELVLRQNFHEFVYAHAQPQQLAELMAVSSDEWDCASLYLAFAFQKQSSSSAP